MKLKSLIMLACITLCSNLFAANLHLNPKADAADMKTISKGTIYPGYCQIEIINSSYNDVRVFGTFDDGSTVAFDIYSFDSPHYISMFYNFYCHAQMYITVESPFYTVYSGWTNVNSTIRIVPYLKNQALAKISTR